jgi:hypothetical protein
MDAEKLQTVTDPLTHRSRVFADPPSEDEGVHST